MDPTWGPIFAALLKAALVVSVIAWVTRLKVKVVDSPWFWTLLFSGLALIGLAAIGDKFAVREAGIEQKQRARQGFPEPSGGAEVEVQVRDDGTLDRPPPRVMVDLRNVAWILWPVFITSAAALFWQAAKSNGPKPT